MLLSFYSLLTLLSQAPLRPQRRNTLDEPLQRFQLRRILRVHHRLFRRRPNSGGKGRLQRASRVVEPVRLNLKLVFCY